MKVMRTYEEITMMLESLNRQREKFIDEERYSLALAVASQIELLKWVLVLDLKR